MEKENLIPANRAFAEAHQRGNGIVFQHFWRTGIAERIEQSNGGALAGCMPSRGNVRTFIYLTTNTVQVCSANM